MATFEQFPLLKNEYVAFDATSLKSLITTRLNSKQIFTDQNFEGSNISSVIDIVAYAYNVLIFYLNQTASESTFTTAELYENINKIVKLLSYKPIGSQTPILPFLATGQPALLANIYTIPRYSYFTINGYNYSFNNDISFFKTTNASEVLTDLQDNNLLYQGTFTEYPIYTATGEPYEVLTISIVDNDNNNAIIDHFNVDVYVKDNATPNAKWEKWTPVQSLFLQRSNSTSYEIRLNENERYEIKFGNNVTGKKLNAGDQVAIYYLKSDGSKGEVGPGLLNNNKLFFFNTPNFAQVKIDTTPENLNIITAQQAALINFTNIDGSTTYIERESVSSIKENSINTFRSQYRLITSDDFISYVSKNYSNIISSVYAVNNWDYISGHLKYYFDLGITNPNNTSRVFFNQVKFADSCNFNNVYIYAVPKLEKLTSLTSRSNYLNASQKQLLLNDLQQVKLTTSEVIINDPVYVAVDVGINFNNETLSPSIADTSFIEISRDITAKRNPEALKKLITKIFTDYFSTLNNNLGATISLTNISNQIRALEGVIDVKTKRIQGEDTIEVNGINLLVYNPVYPFKDISIIAQDTKLPYFKYPYLNNVLDFGNKIRIVTPSIQTITKEY